MTAIQIPTLEIGSNSSEETLAIGKKIGALLQPGHILCLNGDLGVGKTWLSKGIALGLGVPDHEYVNSPAFDLIHEYQGRIPVYHMDFYRMNRLSQDDYEWMVEYLYAEGVCLIEWADRFIHQLADDYLRIEIIDVDRKNSRLLQFQTFGDGYFEIFQQIKGL